jgi:hypothetical protein
MWLGICILFGAILIADAIREVNGIKPWITVTPFWGEKTK